MYSNPSQNVRVTFLKAPRIARPRPYGKLGVKGTAAIVNIHSLGVCSFTKHKTYVGLTEL
jgi:hypothetical protein